MERNFSLFLNAFFRVARWEMFKKREPGEKGKLWGEIFNWWKGVYLPWISRLRLIDG